MKNLKLQNQLALTKVDLVLFNLYHLVKSLRHQKYW